MKPVAIALSLLLFAGTLAAQLDMPPSSPRGTLLQKVGLAQMVIDYGRPGVKGRQIFGGLEPYGRVWRTGANASTKISIDRDGLFGGEPLPAGDYALYTIPEADSWTVIIHKNTELWGAGGYDPADDLLRVTAPVTRTAEMCETLTIDFRGFHINGADLVIRWADVEVAVPVVVDSDAAIAQQIEERITNAREVSPNTYFDAAKYYVETGKDLAQAAAWTEKAVEKFPGAFWMVTFRAEIARDMGDLTAAREWAERAHEMASSAEDDYGYKARTELLLEEIGGASRGG